MAIDIRLRLPLERSVNQMFMAGDTETSNYPNLYSDARQRFDEGELFEDVGTFVEHLEDLGITRACVSGAEPFREEIAEYPDVFVGKAGIDISNGVEAELEHFDTQVEDYGFGMLELAPFKDEEHSSSRKYYPFYAKCVEHDIPVWIHSSSNFSRFASSDYGHPSYLDTVCCDFPNLRVIAGHGGWPWLPHIVALMWKHPNLYLDFSAIRAKYVGQNTDWAPLREYGTTLLKDRILFGTSFPVLDHETQLADVEALDLDPEVERMWLHDNAARVLGLD